MDVWLDDRKLCVPLSRLIGKGGEADVYDLGDGRALKLFKPPGHPDFDGQPEQQEAARRRLALHQQKLPAFPAALPASVVVPVALARATARRTGGAIVGYAMPLVRDAEPLLRWSEASFRAAGASAAQVVNIVHELRATLEGLHASGVVIGDFNDLNVLVRQAALGACFPSLIDADSFQFGPWPCPVFTERFVDPRLCDPAAPTLQLARPFDPSSDWFALAALLTQSFLLVGPWGGIHRPGTSGRIIPPQRRALERHSILRPDVQLPKAAFPREVLPDALLHELSLVFDRDERRPLPAGLLDALHFSRCPGCGLEHARSSCPRCRPSAQAATHTVLTSAGRVLCQVLLETRGRLLAVAAGVNGIHTLVHEGAAFEREDGSQALAGPLDPSLRLALCGRSTVVAKGERLVVLTPGREPRPFPCDRVDGSSALASNHQFVAWASEGRLLALEPSMAPASGALDGLHGPLTLGEVLPGRTHVFLGPEFGLCWTRADGLSFVSAFLPRRRGLLEAPKRLPSLRGHLLRVQATFSDGHCVLTIALRHQGRTRHHALLFDERGALVCAAEAGEGEPGWLGGFPPLCLVGAVLLAATDDGLIRVEARAGAWVETRRYPETQGFLDGAVALQAVPDGLLASTPQRLLRLRLV